jgi:hypothetical protein
MTYFFQKAIGQQPNIRPFQARELEDILYTFGHHCVVDDLLEHGMLAFFRQFLVGLGGFGDNVLDRLEKGDFFA